MPAEDKQQYYILTVVKGAPQLGSFESPNFSLVSDLSDIRVKVEILIKILSTTVDDILSIPWFGNSSKNRF